MQPYLFPYIDYYRLIYLADIHVVLDDVNFIKKGFINRNSVFKNGQRTKFNLLVSKISQNRLICEHEVYCENVKLNRFLQNEIGVQFPDLVANLQREIMQSKGEKLSTVITNLNKIILQELNIQTPIMLSSDFERNLKHGEDKIIEIVKSLGGTCYLNAPGGKTLYSESNFNKNSIKLKFLRPSCYDNFGLNDEEFYQSIIGVLRGFGKSLVQKMILQNG